MSIDWNFPGNNFGTLSGIGEAGIETFKGSPCRSLAREVCQNSLDARLDPGKPVSELVSEEDMKGVDDSALLELCRQAVADNPGAAADYKAGKEKALKAILGAVMKATRGKADAVTAEKILLELLK